jgi:hypothetical protein
MRFLTTTYTEQVAKLPKSGRYIVAQFDEEGVILYQTYCPAISRFNEVKSQKTVETEKCHLID